VVTDPAWPDRRLSKQLSFWLRHHPEQAGLTLDGAGWTPVEDVLRAYSDRGVAVTRDDLDRLVRASDKLRYEYDGSGSRIRASQGHSVPVDLGYAPATPPPLLFHGTAARNQNQILAAGLLRQQRHAVHLTTDPERARQTGSRWGKWVVFQVDAAAMDADGFEFTLSTNGVWLVEHVPPQYIRVHSHHRLGSGLGPGG
jgi:putative RNA 2'-phosphotransferase